MGFVTLKKCKDILPIACEKCHGGESWLICKELLIGEESSHIAYMHTDDMPAGVSIGEHAHGEGIEEVYYLLSGKGILTFDGVEYEMSAGDVSVCDSVHTHGFKAVENCVLIVVAVK